MRRKSQGCVFLGGSFRPFHPSSFYNTIEYLISLHACLCTCKMQVKEKRRKKKKKLDNVVFIHHVKQRQKNNGKGFYGICALGGNKCNYI